MPPTPVLVTGSEGFVGTRLVEHWRALGVDLVAAVRAPAGDSSAVRLDLGETSEVDEVIRAVRPRVVVNLAGIANPRHAAADPVLAYDVNVLGQLRLVMAILRHAPRARLVTAGSALMYGAATEAGPLTESTPPRPDTVYGMTKAAADLQALQYHLSDGLDVVRLRFFNVIGPGRPEEYFPARQVRRLALILAGRADPVLPTYDLRGARDFTDVRDAVSAIVAAAERGRSGAAYNVAAGRATPLRTLLERLLAIGGVDVSIAEEPDPGLVRPPNVIAGDSSRLRRDTQWAPRISLDDSLRDSLRTVRAELAAQPQWVTSA